MTQKFVALEVACCLYRQHYDARQGGALRYWYRQRGAHNGSIDQAAIAFREKLRERYPNIKSLPEECSADKCRLSLDLRSHCVPFLFLWSESINHSTQAY